MPTLALVNFNIVCATLGGFITIFGLVSYLLKERFYLSEALISTIWGIIFSPHAANFIKPLEYARGIEENLETITLYFSRLVLGVQLVLAGVQLPSKYLLKEWKSLCILLGPGMTIMWISTSLLAWALIPNINLVMAISVGACVTPTDPVLSNGIVKGKFADKNIPPPLQKIIIAESGANDGLGYPFLFLGLYLLKYSGMGGLGQGGGGASHAIALWFGETWGYTIILSIAYGFLVGYIAKELLHWAEERHYVDRESFLVFAITLALFIVGTVGLIGSDDVLACFIAGNAFTWDDWFRLETKDDSLQPTIDMLLNVSIFMWYGAVCPWHKFVDNSVIPIYRLIPLGILVLLFRRLPMVFAFHKTIHQLEDRRQTSFVGFFGPIGVSAIFYVYISREFLAEITVDGQQRADAAHLSEVINVVVWFLVVCSIVVHGLSIPVGKAGVHIPRTLSTAISTDRASRSRSPSQVRTPRNDDEPRIPGSREERELIKEFRRRRPTTSEVGPATVTSSAIGAVYAVVARRFRALGGRRTTPEHKTEGGDSDDSTDAKRSGSRPEISNPMNGRILGHPINEKPVQTDVADAGADQSGSGHEDPTRSSLRVETTSGSRPASNTPTPLENKPEWQRSIRFGDE